MHQFFYCAYKILLCQCCKADYDNDRFRECSKYALDSGIFDKALQYAQKELELERLLIGTDTEYLRGDLYGAECWIKSVRERTSHRPNAGYSYCQVGE